MGYKSPEEVLRAVALDIKSMGLTQSEASWKLGNKSKQSLSNLLSRKKYLSGIQAIKFNKAFGYSMPFLMKGEGELRDNNIGYESYKENTPAELLELEPGASELGLLRLYFRRIIEAWGHPLALKILSYYQLFDSCCDTRTLMVLMANIEQDLITLEDEKKKKNK